MTTQTCRSNGTLFAIIATIVVALTLATVVGAQVAGDTGTIYGVVTDALEAVLPNATVTVVNEKTGVSRTTTTGAQGRYELLQLRAGTYTVTVEMSGFKTYSLRKVIVAVTESTRVDVKLELGELAETIEVEAGPVAQVETREITLGGVIEERRIVDMPLNGRNFIQLAYFIPGATQTFRPIALKGSPTNVPGSVEILPFVNGTRNTMNAVLIDGALNNDPVLNTAAIVPVPDAIQEFKIQTNLYTAEYGQGGGSVISILTKSGGRDFRGTAYYFVRNDAFDARNFFTDKTPALRRNQFGFSIGGPIKGIGDKTFFFGNYEGLRLDKGVILNSIVPSLAERSGDFSASSVRPTTDPVGGCITAFVIDPACIDPIAAGLISKLWPEPNAGTNTFRATPLLNLRRDQFLVKLDHNTTRHTFTGRYAFDDGLENTPVAGVSGAGLATGSGVPGFPVTNPSRFQNIMLAHTFIVSPRAVNVFRFTYLRAAFGNNLLVERDDPASFGFTYPINELPGLPAVSVSGFALTGTPGQKDFTKGNNIFLWANNFAYEIGNHSLRLGGELRRSRADINTGNFTAGLHQFRGLVTGSGFADFLFGAPFGLLQVSGDAERDFRSTSYALFFHDAYKLRPTVTLNYGIRWEVFGPFGDPHVFRVGHPRLHTFIPGRQSTYATDLPTGIVLGGFDQGIRTTIVATDYNNLAPRVGIAWDVFGTGKTSVRAGYGIFFDATVLDGVINSTDGTPSIRSAAFPISLTPYTFADPYQGNSPFVPPITFPIPTTTALSPTIVDPDQRTAYVQQWNLTIQQEVPGDMLFQVGYVGTMGTKLTGPLNQAQACLASVQNPCNGLTTNTLANLASRRPYPGLNGLTTVLGVFRSNYHGLQMGLTRRMVNGLAFQLSYTWSKAIDYTSKVNTFYEINGQTNLQDNSNWQADRGLAAFDLRNRFVANFTYQLPFARNATGALRQIAGGWGINGIVTLQGGGPFTVFDSVGRSFTNSGTAERPDLVPGCNPNDSPHTVERWFDTSCFAIVTPSGQRFGTAGRNIVFADGISQFDFSILKRISTSEQTQLEFRAEFFNLFNHPDFAVPISDIAAGSSFGQVRGTSVDERQIQFALKFIF